IAIGVIMAGPLLVFGFMVLPPLAARPFAAGIASFFALSSTIGALTAIVGFYLSIALDLPLGPTDVALGCLALFLSHALSRARWKGAAIALAVLTSAAGASGCSQGEPAGLALPSVQAIEEGVVWVARPRNSTADALRLPSGNPLRSLAEMAGKISVDERPTVMDLLQEELRAELHRRKIGAPLPEARDARLANLPPDPGKAAHVAREAKLSGLLLLSDLLRWQSDGRLLRARVGFRLVRISDGAVVWQRDVRRVVAATGPADFGQASADGVQAIVRELFGS
ncbi:MAG TPA: metal ABC transporter permease, partial [Candidatus Eisenbacteria bacterium]|nr:metal ABC transporter permease [Candidatus Eisenbacteria bacterium]